MKWLVAVQFSAVKEKRTIKGGRAQAWGGVQDMLQRKRVELCAFFFFFFFFFWPLLWDMEVPRLGG